MKFDHDAHQSLMHSTVKTGRQFYKPASRINLKPRLMTDRAWGLACILMMLIIAVVW